MDIKDILTIMDRFDKSTMSQLHLKIENVELNIERQTVATPVAITHLPPAIQGAAAVPATVGNPTLKEEGHIIKSPLVGIYYESASPDAPPLKKAGDSVKAGEVVCILEAMKVFNEIKSPWDGVITSILVSNQDIVEFDQPLMVIERA